MDCANDEKRPKDAPHGASAEATSPYASGGGGVTFERKVAVSYLAHLLVGDAAAELGDERRAVSVAFQQSPDHPVDDLAIAAARAKAKETSRAKRDVVVGLSSCHGRWRVPSRDYRTG
jgi:hypothetical protein